ncbi:MAG: response regulator [Peptococcaceae bacterium]|nr:response regulator [Peptococcaceae bacterium]
MEHKPQILVVDDDPVSLKVVRNALMAKWDVVTIPDAEKMFAFMNFRGTPDLILLDVLMNDENGYDVILRLKDHDATRDIPVIFLTSRSTVEDEMKGFLSGAVDYISKPFIPQLLMKRIELHLQLARQSKELSYFNSNLQQMVDTRTNTVLKLQKAILNSIGDMVEFRDDATGGHIMRTEGFLRLLVEEILDQGIYRDATCLWDVDLLVQSSQLHDVGKIAIPDKVLLKQGKLTNDEFAVMKTHVKQGERILDKIQKECGDSMFLTYARIMASTHHEKWDGSGYPYGLAGKAIPLEGRLMAFADVYDALLSRRPYKEPFLSSDARRIVIEASGSHFDPALLPVFAAAECRFRHVEQEIFIPG